jgi:hypothetical protein
LLKALSIKANADGSFDSSQSEVTLRFYRMDTKRNPSETHKTQAALFARKIIEQWQPDIVVASDDNAAKYLIAPYYRTRQRLSCFAGLTGMPLCMVSPCPM